MLEQVVLAFQSLAHSAREGRQWRLWVPWLPVLALQLGALACLWWFAHPALSWFMAPWLEWVAGESVLHYPNVFRLLPALYGRADLVIVLLAGAVAVGASTVMFGTRFTGRELSARAGVRRALARGLVLVLANLPLNLLVLGLYGLEGWLDADSRMQGASRPALALLILALAILLQAFFLFLNPLLMLGGRGLVASFQALPQAALRGRWAALTLAAVLWVPLLPIQLLAHAAPRIAERGTPELVGGLVVTQIVIALLVAFLLTGGSTLIYQSLVAQGAKDGGLAEETP
jgi:hypothetical protein